MAENPTWPYITFNGAVVFGAGLLGGFFLRKVLGKPTGSAQQIDGFARAARLTALRAQGRGRDHKMVFVVRTDLGMGKGKISAQCAHAAVMCYQKALVMDQENLDLWEATGVTKICLKTDGDDKTLKILEKRAKDLRIVTAIVRDAGHTQIAAGSYTVLGLGPAPAKLIDEVTGNLKLL